MEALSSHCTSLKVALRSLRRSPGYTLIIVLSIALGAGFSTAIFSAYHSVYLEKLPVELPQELALLRTEDFQGNPVQWFSYPDFREYQGRKNILSEVLAYSTLGLNWGRGPEGERVAAVLASSNYFSVAGINPSAGRFLSGANASPPGATAEAVVSHSLWKRRLGGSLEAIGRTVYLNDIAFTVVGVAPKGFAGMENSISAEVWIPLGMRNQVDPGGPSDWTTNSSFQWLTLITRLKAGMNREQAQSAMNAFELSLQQEDGPPRAERRFQLLPAGRANPKAMEDFGAALSTLAWSVAITLLIVSVNLAGLSTVRSLMRRREFAVRVALGAGRSRLMRTILIEAVLLSLAGGFLALIAGQVLLNLLPMLGGRQQPAMDLGFIGVRALAYALLPCLLAAIVFTVIPGMRVWRTDVAGALKNAPLSEGGFRGRIRLRSVLVIGQIGLSMTLLAASLVVVRSLRALTGEELGFEPAAVLMVSLGLGANVNTAEKGQQAYSRLLEQVQGLPGAGSVSLSSIVFGYESTVRGISIAGYTPSVRNELNLDYSVVAPGYFHTMEIALIQGRGFRSEDNRTSKPVAVINEAMKRRFWPDESPLGRSFRALDHRRKRLDFEIVGVAQDSKYLGLRDRYRPQMYFNLLQVYDPQMNLLVRARIPPERLQPAVSREIARLSPDFRVLESVSLAEHIDRFFLSPTRRQSILLTILAAVTLALAVGGLYGAIANIAVQRRFEFGVRLALGSRPVLVAGLIIREALVLIVCGIGIGLLGSLVLQQWLSVRLFKVTPADPLSLAISALIMLASGAAAVIRPALFTARLEPMRTLCDSSRSA